MDYDYTGEVFLDRIFKDLYLSDEVQHTIDKRDRKEEAIRKYMDRLERTHQKARDLNRLELIKELYYGKYVIKKENIPDTFSDEEKNTIIDNQKKRLGLWIDYLSDENAIFPMWAKYWAFQGMLKLGTFDVARGIYQRRSDKTLAPFIEPNPAIITNCIQSMMDYEKSKRTNNQDITVPLQSGSFKKIYEYFERKFNEEKIYKSDSTSGTWIKYNQGSKEDAKKLYESLQGKGVPWCTANESYAFNQVCGGGNYGEGGDFYVYYTADEEGKFTIPRIAIRMNGKTSIGEIRGILTSQCLENEMIDILESKLNEMTFVKDIHKHLDTVAKQKKLNDIYKKTIMKEDLTKEEIISLYTDHFGFGWSQDPLVEKTRQLRNFTDDVNKLNKEEKKLVIKANITQLPNNFIIDNKETLLDLIATTNSGLFKYASSELKNDKEVALTVLSKDASMHYCIGNELKNDRDILLLIIPKYPYFLTKVDKKYLEDRELVLLAVSHDGNIFTQISDELKSDKEVIFAAIINTPSLLLDIDENIKNDRNFILSLIDKNYYVYNYVNPVLKNDRGFIQDALAKNGHVLELLDENYKNDREIVSIAVLSRFAALKYASEQIQNDKEFMADIIFKKPELYLSLSDELKKDKQFNLLLLSKDGSLLYKMEKYNDDEEIIEAALSNNYYSLSRASDRIKNDTELLISWVDKGLRFELEVVGQVPLNDKRFIECLIKNKYYKPDIAKYMGNNIRSDRKIIRSLISDGVSLNNQSNAGAFDYASQDLKKDKEFIRELMLINPYIFTYVDDSIKHDKQFVLELFNINNPEMIGALINSIPEDLRDDKEINLIYAEYYLKTIDENIEEMRGYSLQEIYSAIDTIEQFAKEIILSNKYKSDREILDYVINKLLYSLSKISPEVNDYINSKYSHVSRN